MAPQIQPSSLYNLSLTCVSNLIDQACTTIFLEYGSYGNEECLDAIKKLQKHLMSTLPLSVFEHLSEDRNSSNRNSYQGANQLLIWSKDPRIKLGVFLHPALTKFSVDGRGNELMLLTQQDDFHGSCCSYMGGLDELFWCSHLRRLVNIVSLNLNLITTDEILHLIGANCLKLEVVNIVSRIKQDNVQSYLSSSDAVGEGQAEGGQYIGQFPGISLKFCVTDVGLLALLNCTQLKSITMNKIVNHSPANHGITLQGVRTLVFGLPNLEFISFGSMGKVLAQDIDTKIKGIANKRKRPAPLKLTHFNEMDPSFMDVHRLEVTCPNIQHLSLALPITIHSNGFIDANTSPCITILEALSKSSLPLRILELQHFPFCDAFKQLLVAKGNDLRELLFRAATPVDSQHLTFIGESCPNLQKLHIKDLGPENGQLQDDAGGFDGPVFSFSHHRSDLFSNLVSLHLSGRFWNPHIILPLVLGSATKISKISLLNMTFRTVMDKALVKVMQANKLSEAASISLYSGCFLSIEMLRRLIFGCDKLTCFSFSQSENLDLNDVDRLKLEVASKNLDIKLCCLEMLNF